MPPACRPPVRARSGVRATGPKLVTHGGDEAGPASRHVSDTNLEKQAMLCRRCERRAWSARMLRFWSSPQSVWSAARLRDLICTRCGAVLPAELVTERLLGKLSQLGRFGLNAAGRPLLEPGRPER